MLSERTESAHTGGNQHIPACCLFNGFLCCANQAFGPAGFAETTASYFQRLSGDAYNLLVKWQGHREQIQPDQQIWAGVRALDEQHCPSELLSDQFTGAKRLHVTMKTHFSMNNRITLFQHSFYLLLLLNNTFKWVYHANSIVNYQKQHTKDSRLNE